jgi:hypothetical protein
VVIREWWHERFCRPRLNIMDASVIQGFQYRIMVKNGGKRAEGNCVYMIACGYRQGEPGIHYRVKLGVM